MHVALRKAITVQVLKNKLYGLLLYIDDFKMNLL